MTQEWTGRIQNIDRVSQFSLRRSRKSIIIRVEKGFAKLMRRPDMKQFLAMLSLCLAPVLIQSTLAAQGDWPQWRGPLRNGVSSETGLLKQWPAEGPALVWKATGLGGGYSGVAVAGGRIYTMGEDKDASYLRAMNAADGKILWSVKIGKAGAVGWGNFSGPRSTPTIDGDRIYCLGHFGDLVCVSAEGKVVWQKNLVADFGGARPEWGFAESPLVDGGKVLCTPGGGQGTVIALNKETGKTLWRSKDITDNAQYASIIVETIDGVRQYIQLTDATLMGLGEDGKALWRAARPGKTAVIPTPVYYDHYVFVTSGYEAGCNLFQISKTEGGFTAKQVYASKDFMNHHGGVVQIGDYVYGHSERKGWMCQEIKTGKIMWNEKEKMRKGSICAVDGLLVLRAEDEKGTVALVEASPEGYVEKGRFDQPDRSNKNSWPHPVIANGRLYLRDQDVLLCYELKK
jgi:outer membrane protein assembly factor BamB